MDATNNSNSNARKGGKAILIIAIVVIIALAGVIGFLLATRGGGNDQGADAAAGDERRNVVVTEDNVEEVLDKLEADDQKVKPGYYTVTMPTTWHFNTGSEASDNAVVENVPANTNDVYFDIVMAGEEDHVLYRSPVLPVGSRLEDITLEEALPAGTYDCIMIYSLIDDEQTVLSTVRVGLTIIIEE